jgi:hypothetical protein
MALFYNAGLAMVPARIARERLGADVYLCAPGPSLIPMAPEPGIYIAALTKAYPAVRPHLWIGMDEPPCYDRRLWFEGFEKIVRLNFQDVEVGGVKLKDLPNVLFASCDKLKVADIFANLQDAQPLIWVHDTLFVALHVLVRRGARRIFFNGFDLRHVAGADYHVQSRKVLTPELRARNQVLFDKQVRLLREFAAIAGQHGIACVSVTPGSRLNAFMPYVPLAEALAGSRAAVPAAGEILHCRELEGAKAVAVSVSSMPDPFRFVAPHVFKTSWG